MAATLATVEAYLTAAQAAINTSDYQEARKQAVLAQMELAKLLDSDTVDAQQSRYRRGEEIEKLLRTIDALETAASASGTPGVRVSVARVTYGGNR